MKKQRFMTFVIILILFSLPSGCDLTSSDIDSTGIITFTVPIDVDMFSDEATLRFTLCNADQLEIMKRTAKCSITYDLETQTEEIHCPEGIMYEEIIPDEFTFPVQEIGEIIEVESDNIRIGEKYRLMISGLSSDNCNTTSASVESIAQHAEIVIEDLMWMTTLMACP